MGGAVVDGLIVLFVVLVVIALAILAERVLGRFIFTKPGAQSRAEQQNDPTYQESQNYQRPEQEAPSHDSKTSAQQDLQRKQEQPQQDHEEREREQARLGRIEHQREQERHREQERQRERQRQRETQRQREYEHRQREIQREYEQRQREIQREHEQRQREHYERRLEAYSDQIRNLEHYISSRELRYPQGFGSDEDHRHRHKLLLHDLDYVFETIHRDLERLEKRNPNLFEGELSDQYANLKRKEQGVRDREKRFLAR